ncbi:hypothetical protein BDR05DRAFT_954165 [Suillus weaverae]|nr:hypothetical protein BDR05DRAFT_954165 [Suillus weaverae]
MLLEFGGATESAGLGVVTALGVAEVTGAVWLGVMVANILAGVIAAGADMAELDIAGSIILVGVVTGMVGAAIAELDIAGAIVLVGVMTGIVEIGMAEASVGELVLEGVVAGVVEHDTVGAEEVVAAQGKSGRTDNEYGEGNIATPSRHPGAACRVKHPRKSQDLNSHQKTWKWRETCPLHMVEVEKGRECTRPA